VDFTEVVRSRRMVRNYTDEPVAPEVLERIIAAGRKAPSAGFSQGQVFVVVTEPERRSEIARLAHEDGYVAQGFDPWISRAPVHIVICVRKETYLERYREPDKGGPEGVTAQEEGWPVPYWWVDSGASMMLVLLATVNEGLAAGFLGSHRMGEIKEYLDIPDDVAPIGIVTIGHPAPDRAGSRKRGWRPEPDVIHRERW
jgi:nitroreductase